MSKTLVVLFLLTFGGSVLASEPLERQDGEQPPEPQDDPVAPVSDGKRDVAAHVHGDPSFSLLPARVVLQVGGGLAMFAGILSIGAGVVDFENEFGNPTATGVIGIASGVGLITLGAGAFLAAGALLEIEEAMRSPVSLRVSPAGAELQVSF
jgi:hypothetical protein